jgi:hypothetical protein
MQKISQSTFAGGIDFIRLITEVLMISANKIVLHGSARIMQIFVGYFYTYVFQFHSCTSQMVLSTLGWSASSFGSTI